MVTAYRFQTALLCVDRQSRTFVSLQPGTVAIRVKDEPEGMVVLRWREREFLAFAVDLDHRARAVTTTT